MPTRVIMIEFNQDVTSGQIEQFQQELKALADELHYKTGFRCGTNRRLGTETVLDTVAPEVEVNVPQFVAIWEFGSYDDLSRFVGDSHHLKFASDIAKKIVRRRWVVNI